MKRLSLAGALAALFCGFGLGGWPVRAAQDTPPLEGPRVGAEAPARAGTRAVDPIANLRQEGPPRELPPDPAGPAPGPDFFWVPGQYVPSGAGVTWRPGFWARLQPGWEWVPARWVRLAQGWSYREGHWERVESDPAAPVAPQRHVVARPVPAPGPAGPSVPDPPPPTELAPLPEGDTGSTPATPPLTVRPPTSAPAPSAPLVPFGPPVTEINAPGVRIRVVPPVPWVSTLPPGYGGIIVPPVQVRVVRPLRGVRQMVRDILDGVLP